MIRRSLVIAVAGALAACSSAASTTATAPTVTVPIAATTFDTTSTTAATPIADSTTTAPEPTTSEASTTTMATPATPGEPGIADPYFPGYGNGGYDVEQYDISIVWQPKPDTPGVIAGTTTIIANASRPLTTFNLDFSGLDLASVTVDGDVATFTRDGNELTVDPVVDIDPGEFTVVATYSGTPEFRAANGGNGGGWLGDGAGGAFILGEPESAATWFPVNDHPSDKARYRISVTAPSNVVVGSLGRPTDPVPAEPPAGVAGDVEFSTWVFEPENPIVPYALTVVIGDYEILDGGRSKSGVTLRNVVPRGRADEFSILALQPEMIDFFESWFGPYPHEIYGAAVVANLAIGTALETQTLSIFTTDAVEETLLAHELGHQWFGDSVGIASWQDIWLAEGFATYCEILWKESRGGTPEQTGELIRQLVADSGPALDLPPGDPGADNILSPTVYRRGMMTLHALRLEVGDDIFRDIATTFATRYRDGNATTDDFIAIAEEQAGRSLDTLFEAWLFAPKLPARLGDIILT